MKLNTELKIGVTGIITIAAIIWGINYLKGKNILSGNNRYVAFYNQVDGLEPSANIMLNGFKIGVVEDIQFNTESKPHFTVALEIEKKYKIRKGSLAEIFSSDLLGTKAIRIVQSSNPEFAISGDTLKSSLGQDMIGSIINELKPVAGDAQQLITTLDSVGKAIHSILRDPSTQESVRNIENVAESLKAQLSHGGNINIALENLRKFSDSLHMQTDAISGTLSNLEEISESINKAELDSIFTELNATIEALNSVIVQINSGEGSVGKLLNEDSLYNYINIFIADLDSLVNDINENPKKYVRFSIF